MITTASDMKISEDIRILQIIAGIIAIDISVAVISNLGFGLELLIFLLSITLFVVGIEKVSIGFFPNLTKSSRISNIVLVH
jgi:uncharacterized membrane protein HdeD (DUF308 family)